MNYLILAAALGANTVIVFLLFRRLKRDVHVELGRQVTAIRVEINRDRVIRQLSRPEGTAGAGGDEQAAVANGTGPEHPPVGEQPIRRKRHLAVYRGGALVATLLALGGIAQETYRSHRSQVVGVLVGATATATTVTLLTVTPWSGDTSQRTPSSAPTATVTATVPASPPGQIQPPSTFAAPTISLSPSAASSTPSHSPDSSPSGPTRPPVSSLPVISESHSATESDPTNTDAPSSSATASSSPATEEPPTSSGPPPSAPAAEEPVAPDGFALRVELGLARAVNAQVSLLRGGAGR